jgi:three-Cys-motif partner protein
LGSYIEIKGHSHRKYTILQKYLDACQKFEDRYHNFAYVDTHGGTGMVLDLTDKIRKPGSVLTAARITPTFPCYTIEIDDLHFALLEHCTKSLSNVTRFHGDCNTLIHSVLSQIERGKRFVFCFLDPCGLIYTSDDVQSDQLNFETIRAIADFPRSEILLNFPVEAVMQTSGVAHSETANTQLVVTMRGHLNRFFGCDDWMELDPGDYRGFLRSYLDRVKRVAPSYEYSGAVLIRSAEKNAPQYYLTYFSQHIKGGKIMRDIMAKEWREIIGGFPLTRLKYRTISEWLDGEYPLEKPFIFED